MRQRIQSLQALRAIAFILVFLSHVELIPTGPVAVSIFLVLSGFCMAYSYVDIPERQLEPSIKNNIRFAWKKIRKLYPLHLLTLLLVAAVTFFQLFRHSSSIKVFFEQGAYFVANAFLLQSWIPWREGYFSFNAVSWYLSVIVFSYFLFPWLLKISNIKQRRKIFFIGIVCISIMITISMVLYFGLEKLGWRADFVKWCTYVFPLYRTGDFVVGLIAGMLYLSHDESRHNPKTTILEIVVLGIIIIQVIIYPYLNDKSSPWKYSLFWIPITTILIYLYAREIGLISVFLSKRKSLIWLGNISGEAFLIHHICIKAVEYVSKNQLVIAGVSFILAIVIAICWRHLVKRYQKHQLNKVQYRKDN